MADIPSVFEFLDTLDNSTDLGKWREFTENAIARCIKEYADALKSGNTVHFKFPLLRDMGKYKKLWTKHYLEMAVLLSNRGWVVESDVRPPDVQLAITLPRKLISDKSNSTM